MAHRIKGMIKVNVRVKELQPALDIFANLFDASLIQNRGSDTIGDFDGATVDMAGTVLDFVAPNTPDSVVGKTIEKRGEGIDSIAFEVENLEDTAAVLKARGIDLINRHEIRGNKVGFVHPKNACGVLIELIQTPS